MTTKKSFKTFINQATQYTCEVDFYHSLADGETKTQKGSMPYQRAQRGPVAELQTKQLVSRYTNIWCCILLLLLLLCFTSLVFQVSDHNPTVTQNSSNQPFHFSVNNTLSVTQTGCCSQNVCDFCVISDCPKFSCSGHFSVLDTLEPTFLFCLHRDSSCLKFHHVPISAIFCLWSWQRQSHIINISPENIAQEIVFVSPLLCLCHLLTGFHPFYITNKSPCLHF